MRTLRVSRSGLLTATADHGESTIPRTTREPHARSTTAVCARSGATARGRSRPGGQPDGTVNAQVAPTYSAGRVFRMGDAVHRHPPTLSMIAANRTVDAG